MGEYIGIEGALFGLLLSIILILRGFNVPYSLLLGAFIGAVVGGKNLEQSTNLMLEGASSIIPAVIRVMSSGVLVGVLIKSGASQKIGLSVVQLLGNKGRTMLLFAITIATVFLTSLGIIPSIAIITMAPIALDIGKSQKISKEAILLALIGGGQAGNIISLNANTIVVMNAFQVPLVDLIMANILPALGGIIVTTLIATFISSKGTVIEYNASQDDTILPPLWACLTAPICIIFTLVISSIYNVSIDPLIVLPLSALIGCLAMGKFTNFSKYSTFGLHKMSEVVLLLLSVGALAGVIKYSEITILVPMMLEKLTISTALLAPIAGMVLSAATPSVTTVVTIASNAFSDIILDSGVSGLNAAAMLQVGAVQFDHLPHGSLFHATAGAVDMNVKQRMKTLHWETITAFTLVLISVLLYGF